MYLLKLGRWTSRFYGFWENMLLANLSYSSRVRHEIDIKLQPESHLDKQNNFKVK